MKKLDINSLSKLVEEVVIPFEHYILDDDRISHLLSDSEVQHRHNSGITKLAITLTRDDIASSKELLKKGAMAHNNLTLDKNILREYLTIFFKMHKSWMQSQNIDMSNYLKNLNMYENFFMSAYKESAENNKFLDFDSLSIDKTISKIKLSQSKKIDAKTFMLSSPIDKDIIEDIIESIYTLEAISNQEYDFNLEYVSTIGEAFKYFISAFDMNYEFQDIATSLRLFYDNLDHFDLELFDIEEVSLVKLLIGNLAHDLTSWAYDVTIEKTSSNIHEYDASILTNLAQIDIMMSTANSKVMEMA